MTTTHSATYTKLQSGAWGIRVPGKAEAGQSVTVKTKAGAEKIETVEKVLWTGKDSRTGETVSLCAIEQRETRQNSGFNHRAPRGTYAPGGKKCSYCGQRDCEGAWGGLCDQD